MKKPNTGIYSYNENFCEANEDCTLVASDCATRCSSYAINMRFKDKWELDCSNYTDPISPIPCQELEAVCENKYCVAKPTNIVEENSSEITICGDGICKGGESPFGCDPSPADPDICKGHIFCPEDCVN